VILLGAAALGTTGCSELIGSGANDSDAAQGAAPPPGRGRGGDNSYQQELHLKWRAPLDGAYSFVRPVVGPDGTVYVVDVADNLYAFDPSTFDPSAFDPSDNMPPEHEPEWIAREAGGKGVDVGPDGTIYTGNENWVKAYNPDGSLKWTFVQNPRAFVFQDVAVGPDGHVYGIGTSGLGVFSLDDEGSVAQLRWATRENYGRPFDGYAEIEFGPTIYGQDGPPYQLYFHANGFTRAIGLSDGAEVFSAGGGNTNPRVSPVDGTWHRPDSAYYPNGELVWTFAFPTASGTREPTLGASGTHYAVNSGNVLYAIDIFGARRWSTTLDEFVGLGDVDPTESQILLQAGNTANGGALWRMEFPDDGSELLQFVDSGAAFSRDGTAAYIMTSFAGFGGHAWLNAIDTDPGAPSASTILRSVAIDFDSKRRRREVNVTGIVHVTDENRATVSGAQVHVVWTLPDGSTKAQSATTSGGGDAKFKVAGADGLYHLTVNNVTLESYVFDPHHGILENSWYAF
jgi:outer membrane protein assembly factor BamB